MTGVDYLKVSDGQVAVANEEHACEFLDINHEVAFVKNIENNENLAKLEPAFSHLEELYKTI